jgi:hypothetical protein
VEPDERRKRDWDPWQRFRPYRAWREGRLELQRCIAEAGCETAEGIGPMLQNLLEDGEFTDQDRVGILDTGPWEHGEPAVWVINPHATGRGGP